MANKKAKKASEKPAKAVKNSVSGNGHKKGVNAIDLPPQFEAWVNEDTIRGAFTSQVTVQAVQYLVDPGEAVRKLWMRSDLRSYEQAMALVTLYRMAVKYEADEIQEMILDTLAALPAIKGKRAQMLLDAIIGEQERREKGRFSNFFKDKLKMGESDDK